MAKTKAEKITSIEEEIRQLENRRRQLVQVIVEVLAQEIDDEIAHRHARLDQIGRAHV